MIYIAIQENQPRAAALNERPAPSALVGAPGVRGLVANRGPVLYETYATAEAAHTAITNGLTKEELVDLGDDLGLTLSESWLKAKLLDAILNHLEGLS
jgi:hypothetical protein